MDAARPSQRRRWVNVGMALLGFVLVCASLRLILPFPEIGVIAANLRFLKKHQTVYDTIFIGSSLTRRQISPAVFDRVMAAHGHPTRSFNFGINGMFVAEASYVLDRILETKPERLKWVFIELDEIDTRPFAGAKGSRRDLYWRDGIRTWLLVRKLFGGGGDPYSMVLETDARNRRPARDRAGRWELLSFHLSHFGKNITNVSRRTDVAWWGSHFWKPDKMPDDLGPDGDGYHPFDFDMSEERKLPYQYQIDQARPARGSRFVSNATTQAYRHMAEQVRSSGATPVFLGMPVFSQVRLRFRPESGIQGIVMSFNDEKTYPDLYRIDLHAEELHLNRRGTELFSTLVAERFSEELDKQPHP